MNPFILRRFQRVSYQSDPVSGQMVGNIAKASESDFRRISVQVANSVTDSLGPAGVMLYNDQGQIIESIDFNRSPEELAERMYSPENMVFLVKLAKALLRLPEVTTWVSPLKPDPTRDVERYQVEVEVRGCDLLHMPTTFEDFLAEAVKYEVINQLWLNRVSTEEEETILATQIGAAINDRRT